MIEAQVLITDKGTPTQITSLRYYLWQIAIQKNKQKEDLDKYKKRTDSSLLRKKKTLDKLTKRYTEFVVTLTKEEFDMCPYPDTSYEGYLDRRRQYPPSLLMFSRMNALNEDIKNCQDQYEKEYKRREEAYNVKIQRFIIKIEALAKKVN